MANIAKRFGEWVVELDEFGVPHIVPADDWYPHFFEGCFCMPELKDGTMVHKSFDKREDFETGRRKPS